MGSPQALDTDQAKTIAGCAIVLLLIAGLVASLIVRAVVGKIISVVLVVVLAVVVWTQRASIEDAAKKCDATFFGVHLTPSNPDVKKRCQELSR